MADNDATSVSPPQEEIVTITVNIDTPGLSKHEAQKWQKDAEDIWNAAFDQWPHQCYKFKLVVKVTPQDSWPVEKGPRPGHHLIFIGEFVESHGTHTSGVRGSAVADDSPYALQNAMYGAWGDDLADAENKGMNAYAHEVGHLLGLGDDYINHPATATSKRWTEPKPGRKNTLMADGGPVDKNLVDRLADLLRQAKKLPSCWHGKMDSKSTVTYQEDFLTCTEVWNIEVWLRAAPDGTVAGKAVGNLVEQQNCRCKASWDFSRQSHYATFDVKGQFNQQQFELQFLETYNERSYKEALQGISGYQGLLNHTLFIPSHPGPQPTIIVPITTYDKAEGTTTIERLSNGRAIGVHVVHLAREDFLEQPTS
jgi:hypothetical protein